MIQIIQILLISWWITRFKPLQMLIEYIISKSKNRPILSILMSFIMLPMTCLACCMFWSGLIITHNPFIAIGASLIGTWYEILFGYKEKITPLN